MRSEVKVTFPGTEPVRIDLTQAEQMSSEEARTWLDRQFTELGCEPVRPTGKVLAVDKVVMVAEGAGAAKFQDAAWAKEFARAVGGALNRPYVHVDVATMAVSF
ncbi:MAG: hypothetical protein Q8R01_03750 [Ramlibacter sp.]|nr:hypothetical protein [Ramlibacter sp.]